jgi:DNA invertase Pin-like site-specific DNA recombinase
MIKPKSQKIPVLIFCRVSSNSNKQCFDYQIQELKQYCEANNYKIVHTIANNISGRTGAKRPDLDELFELAKNASFKKVIITSMERLGRDAKMIRRTIDFLHSKNIPVVFKNQNFESLDHNLSESFVTNVLISLYAELSMEDNKQRAIKIRSGMMNAKRKGKRIGKRKGDVKTDAKLLKEYSKLATDIKKGFSLVQCSKLNGVSKNTVIKVKRALSI